MGDIHERIPLPAGEWTDPDRRRDHSGPPEYRCGRPFDVGGRPIPILVLVRYGSEIEVLTALVAHLQFLKRLKDVDYVRLQSLVVLIGYHVLSQKQFLSVRSSSLRI